MDVDPMHVWETYKCYNRGILIKLGTKRKKLRRQEVDKILTHIHDLEAMHKRLLSITVAAQLKTLSIGTIDTSI